MAIFDAIVDAISDAIVDAHNAKGSGVTETATLGWSALVADPNDYEITLQDTGSGSPAITRGTTMAVLDTNDGYYDTSAINEAGIEGRITGSAGSRVVYSDNGAGSELTTWGMRIAPEHTNIVLQSNNIVHGQGNWIDGSTFIGAKDAVGLDGTANSGSTLTDDNVPIDAHQILCYNDITDSTLTTTTRLFIEKEDDETHYPCLQGSVSNGGSGGTLIYRYDLMFNKKTGAYTDFSVFSETSYRAKVVDRGTFWEFLVEQPNNGTGDNVKIGLYPGGGTVWGTYNSATTGTMVVANAELYENATLEQIEGSAPIITTTAPLGTDPQQSEWAAANFDNTSDFAISFELEGNVGDGTELLVHSDTTDGSTVVADSSNNSHTVSFAGTAEHDDSRLVTGMGISSLYMPSGAGNNLLTSNISFNHNAPYTIEFFLNVDATTSSPCVLYHGGSTQYLRVYVDSTNELRVVNRATSGNVSWGTTGAGTIVADTWYHIVIQLDNNKVGKIYIDGDLKISIDLSASTFYAPITPFYFGGNPYQATNENVWMDEIKLNDQMAIYSGQTFTPPDAPFADPEPLVPNPILATEDTDTVLLVHSDTFDGDTNFEDSSYIDTALTPTGVVHDTAQSVFGSTSIHFPSASARIAFTPGTWLDIGTGDFQFDYRIRYETGSVYHTPFGNGYVASTDLLLQTTNASGADETTNGIKLYLVIGGTVRLTESPTGCQLNKWYTYRVMRVSGQLYIYRDGVLTGGPVANTTSISAAVSGLLGHASNSLRGWLDEFRLKTAGLDAIGAYTPATSPFDRGTLAQYEMSYIDSAGNLVLEDQGGAKATAPLSAGNNKCGIFKESGNLGVTVGGTTGTLVASSDNVGGNGKILAGHGVTSPILIKKLKGYTGSLLQTQMETNTI